MKDNPYKLTVDYLREKILFIAELPDTNDRTLQSALMQIYEATKPKTSPLLKEEE